MSLLDELKKKRALLDIQIEKEWASHTETMKRIALSLNYTKVACPGCDGTGEACKGGADIESDPPFTVTCPGCGGDGFLYARKWEGPRGHDMDHNQVCAP